MNATVMQHCKFDIIPFPKDHLCLHLHAVLKQLETNYRNMITDVSTNIGIQANSPAEAVWGLCWYIYSIYIYI